MDRIIAALEFLGMVELLFTLVIALVCGLVLVGCGILSATPAYASLRDVRKCI